MNINVNGVTRNMTVSEQAEIAQVDSFERRRPFTEQEIISLFLNQQANTITVDDHTALRMIALYPHWSELVGKTVNTSGYKFQYNGDLYKVIPSTHTFHSNWIPGSGTESLYARINITHSGDLYDPIPYDGNIALTRGKYYIQNHIVYLCIRDSVDPVYSPLQDLLGNYVEMLSP